MVDPSTLTAEEATTLLTRLEKAIYSGARIVQFADRQITYRSLAEMQNMRNELRAKINRASGVKRTRRVFAEYDRGLS